MSIKLYDAFALPLMDLRAVLQLLQPWAESVRRYNDRYALRLMAKFAADIIDCAALNRACDLRASLTSEFEDVKSDFVAGWVAPGYAAIMGVGQAMHRQQYRAERSPTFDIDCKVDIVPNANRIMLLVHSEQGVHKRLFQSIRGMRDWHFQNSYSPHDGKCSDEEWQQRELEWKAVIGPDFVHKSVRFDAVGVIRPMPRYDDLLRYIPRFERRVAVHAEAVALQQFWDRDPPDVLKDGVSAAMRRLHEWSTHRPTTDGQSMLAAAADELRPKLAPVITREMLGQDVFIKFKKEQFEPGWQPLPKGEAAAPGDEDDDA